MSAALKKRTGSAGGAAPVSARVVVVVQPDADDLADSVDRRPDSHASVFEPRQVRTALLQLQLQPLQCLGGEGRGDDVGHEVAYVDQAPVRQQGGRTLRAGRAHTQ